MKRACIRTIFLLSCVVLPFLHIQVAQAQQDKFVPVSLSSTIDRVQPMTGIVFWTTNLAALQGLGDSVQLEFSYMVFSDIVVAKGVYDWSVVDAMLDDIASRGHQAVLRFRYTYPGHTEISVPAYVAYAEGYNRTSATISGQLSFVPDWSFEGLETFTNQFFMDFAERYDGDPRLALLQVGFGSFAEYHLYQGPRILGKTFPSKKFQKAFFETMNDSFQTTQWGVSIDAANSEYGPFRTKAGHAKLDFGLFDDSLMHKNHSVDSDEYNRASWLFFGTRRYQRAIMGGELNYYSDYDQQNMLNLPDGSWGRDFESFVDQYHLSYVIGNDQYKYQSPERIKSASLSMGYKFHVENFEASSTQSRFRITNTGVAPIYYDAYPAVNGARSSTSLKGLLPNKSLEFLIESGGTDPQLTIESDHLVEGQEIQYSAN